MRIVRKCQKFEIFAGANSTLSGEDKGISVVLWMFSDFIMGFSLKLSKYVMITLISNFLPLKTDIYAQ